MRLTRRGMFAGQDNQAYKYIWEVYNLAYGRKRPTGDTGSFTLGQNNYKMAANAYTDTSSQFTLTKPVQTTAANLKVGQYLVNITTSNNTTTSGTYLYQITSITGTSTRTISYRRYSVGFTADIGSFTLGQNNYKMAASAYAATSSQFTLTSPVQTTGANLKVGQYLVNITTSNNTTTSGTYLYQIISIEGTTTKTINYQRYSVGFTDKGSYINMVYSQTPDYPVDDPQNSYYYVMVKGEREVFVWNRYKAVTTVNYDSVPEGVVYTYRVDTINGIWYGTAYTFDKTTGRYTITNAVWYIITNLATAYNLLADKYVIGTAGNSSSTMAYGSRNLTTESFYNASGYHSVRNDITTKGAADGTVESIRVAAYSVDGYQGTYWYTYAYSYMQEFDNT